MGGQKERRGAMYESTLRDPVVGLFDDLNAAETAIWRLQQLGFNGSRIGFLSSDSSPQKRKQDAEQQAAGRPGTSAPRPKSARNGLGSLTISLGVIPGVGPIIAAGPPALLLLRPITGEAIGCLEGALQGIGLSEEAARFYGSEIKHGRYFVSVEDGTELADRIFKYCGASMRSGDPLPITRLSGTPNALP
jgi:hypothetical protein